MFVLISTDEFHVPDYGLSQFLQGISRGAFCAFGCLWISSNWTIGPKILSCLRSFTLRYTHMHTPLQDVRGLQYLSSKFLSSHRVQHLLSTPDWSFQTEKHNRRNPKFSQLKKKKKRLIQLPCFAQFISTQTEYTQSMPSQKSKSEDFTEECTCCVN